MNLLRRGAEADLYYTAWNNSSAILKIRTPKKYRNNTLDLKIRRYRTIKESTILSQVKSFGIPTPLVYLVNLDRYSILMQNIPGVPVHDIPNDAIVHISLQLGKLVGKLHKNGVMHGDLTTSNFITDNSYNTIYLIDFGLSNNTVKPEDHAVDLRLFKEILNSAHANVMESAWNRFLAGYTSIVSSNRSNMIQSIVSDIESRGRYANVV